jgi:alpha-beta hydrolase superfamily lysophospholipase
MQTLTFRPALFCVLLASSLLAGPAASAVKVVKQDYQIDSVDPGIRLFVRSKMAEGTKALTNDNIVLFVHGATFPSTPDFDLPFKDYSWADWMVQHGYVVYMFDKRNYGFSSQGKAMEMPPDLERLLNLRACPNNRRCDPVRAELKLHPVGERQLQQERS